MVFVVFCLDDVPILSDLVVIQSVIHFETLQFSKWWKSNLWQQQEIQAAVYTYKNVVLSS